MDSPVDNTAVFRMRKDFDAFLSGSGTRLEMPSFRLDLDKKLGPSRKKPATNEDIRAIIEKEKAEKLREAELLAARSQITRLESQLTSTQMSNKRARIEFEKDLGSMKHDRERETEQLSDLRAKLKQSVEGEKLARAELAEGQRDWEAARAAMATKLSKLQGEKMQLEADIQKVKEESWQQMMELKHEAGRSKAELELKVTELEESREQLRLQSHHMEELTEKLNEFEETRNKLRVAEGKIKDLEEQISKQAEDAAVNRSLREDIDKVPGLLKEVNRLRVENEYLQQQQQNAHLLQEQLISAQHKLEAAEKRGEKLAELEVEHEELKRRLQRWEAEDVSGSRRPQSPAVLSQRVQELQTAQLVALEEKGRLQSDLSMMELKLKEARELHQKIQGEFSVQQMQTQQLNELIKRLRRKLLLVTKERESYKRILDGYESEITVPVPASSRIQELEDVVEGYRQQVQELETQLQQTNELHAQTAARCFQLEQQCEGENSTLNRSLRADQDKIHQLQEQVVQMEQELKKAVEEKEILEMRIEQRNLQGDYDPTRTKVLHFSANPASLAQQQREKEVERLQEENARLAARVQLLEQSGGPVEDLTMQVEKQLESVPESKLVEELKAQLSREELRKQRLVEAFKKTSQEFRETCYQLLGYKIDLPCTGQYRLASMYSSSPQDYLLFKQGSSGEIQMLETEFSRQQQDKMELYLQTRDSIPALLSSITLDLFNQQTMSLD
ncbi:hypothetical protein BaRGS_00007868 [Batillaria attramentaria]|uniref:Mitotic spindle assembly checkpoint protein MAD1 n=1 Tax=Batillaria attramentaria TaxID=370345 RepID=A0ABD0LPR3_9CAEN